MHKTSLHKTIHQIRCQQKHHLTTPLIMHSSTINAIWHDEIIWTNKHHIIKFNLINTPVWYNSTWITVHNIMLCYAWFIHCGPHFESTPCKDHEPQSVECKHFHIIRPCQFTTIACTPPNRPSCRQSRRYLHRSGWNRCWAKTISNSMAQACATQACAMVLSWVAHPWHHATHPHHTAMGS